MAKPFVVKLAQPGIDVKTAGDENLVYNSNWPLLKIHDQGQVSIDTQPSRLKITDHNLGYVPAYWYIANTTLDVVVNSSVPVSDYRAEWAGDVYFTPSVDKTSLYYDMGINPDKGPNKFYYYIFALDIETPYLAPKIRSGGVIGPRNTKTVFKLAKQNKDISSSSLEDYVINSEARSPMIHAVTQLILDSTGSATFNHNLGYVPMFFAFFRADGLFGAVGALTGTWISMNVNGSQANSFKTDENKISYVNGNPGDHVAIVILKDPFEISYTIGVSV